MPARSRRAWCLALLLLPALSCRAGDPQAGVALRPTLALGLTGPAVATGRVVSPGSRLSALVIRAWQENPEAAVSQASVGASQARLEQAQAELRPQVSLRADATLSRVDGVDYAVSENYMSGQLNAVYPLYRPRLTRGVKVAEAQVSENRAAALEAANELALQLISVYLDLNNLREDLRVIDAESALVDSLRAVNVRRLEGGIGATTDRKSVV
jgi:outer membrane protein TolC